MKNLNTKSRFGIFLLGVGVGMLAISWYMETLEVTDVITSSILVVSGLLFYMRSHLKE